MQALLQMLKTNGGKASVVQEDALTAIGTLVEVLGLHFLKYIDHVLPFLYEALNNHSEYQICSAAVGVVCDLSRSLSEKLSPYCDQIMTHLLTCLNDDKLHRSVKPQILSTFGDIALAIGSEFKKYLEHVVNTLGQACRAQVVKNDCEMIDYLNNLRESCLSAYTGIIQGLRNAASTNAIAITDLQLVTAQLPFLVQFLETIANDSNKDDDVIGAAIGLIGDLVTTYGQQILQLVERESFEKLLVEGKRSKVMKTKTLANWAMKEIRKLKNG